MASLRTKRLVGVLLAGGLLGGLAGCGAESKAEAAPMSQESNAQAAPAAQAGPVTVAATLPSLTKAGWSAVKATSGMRKAVGKVKQTGYLVVTSPDGTTVDVQFMPTADDATAEIDATKQADAAFIGTADRNAVIFSHPDGHLRTPPNIVDRLTQLLQG